MAYDDDVDGTLDELERSVTHPEEYEPHPDFPPERDRGQMHEASEDAFTTWAERYDELNGAPDSDEDR